MAESALITRAAVLLLAVAGTACATGDGMQNKLRDATSAYNRSVRWGDFDRAADHLPGSSQPAFLAHHDEIGEVLVIVDYELTRLDLDKQSGIAASRAEISWHTDRRLIVETTTVDQLWQWHDGRFVLVDERRSGGVPLAIFAEPGEEQHPYLPGLEAYRKAYAIGEDRNKPGWRRRGRRAAEPAPPPGSAEPAASEAAAVRAGMTPAPVP